MTEKTDAVKSSKEQEEGAENPDLDKHGRMARRSYSLPNASPPVIVTEAGAVKGISGAELACDPKSDHDSRGRSRDVQAEDGRRNTVESDTRKSACSAPQPLTSRRTSCSVPPRGRQPLETPKSTEKPSLDLECHVQSDEDDESTKVNSSPNSPTVSRHTKTPTNRKVSEIAIPATPQSGAHWNIDVDEGTPLGSSNLDSPDATRHSKSVPNQAPSRFASHVSSPSQGRWNVDALLKRIEYLSIENSKLKRKTALAAPVIPDEVDRPGDLPQTCASYRCQILHYIGRSVFTGAPSWAENETGGYIIMGHELISDTEEYYRVNRDVAFVICRKYDESAKVPAPSSKGQAQDGELPPPKPQSECVRLVVPEMEQAMRGFLSTIPELDEFARELDFKGDITAPYLFWYHFRNRVSAGIGRLSGIERDLMLLFRDWIEGTYKGIWGYVDGLFSRRMVTPWSIRYLVRPGEVVVSRKGKGIVSYIAAGWVKEADEKRLSKDMGSLGTTDSDTALGNRDVHIWDRWGSDSAAPPDCCLAVWRWGYDGTFRKVHSTLNIVLPASAQHNTVAMSSLEVYPLRFGDGILRNCLWERGQTFWMCRKRRLVSYASSGGVVGSVSPSVIRSCKFKLKY